MTAYRATAERRGSGWWVEAYGERGLAGFDAQSLEQVERKVRRVVWSHTGWVGEIDLDLRLPGATADRLYVIGQLRLDLDEEVVAASGELAELGLSVPDIERVFDIGLRDDTSTGEPAKTIGWRLAPLVVGEVSL